MIRVSRIIIGTLVIGTVIATTAFVTAKVVKRKGETDSKEINPEEEAKPAEEVKEVETDISTEETKTDRSMEDMWAEEDQRELEWYMEKFKISMETAIEIKKAIEKAMDELNEENFDTSVENLINKVGALVNVEDIETNELIDAYEEFCRTC